MSDLGSYDLLVAGGGNAALCAAIEAAERGLSVLVCEAAPKGFRGGNSRHVRNHRAAHDEPTEVLTGAYTLDEYLDDLMRVTGGKTNERLARMTIDESRHIAKWMGERGVRFQGALGGTLSLGRTNPFFLGGGKALLNALYRHAEAQGVHVLYDAEITGLEIEDGFFNAARLRHRGFDTVVRARALAVASGGFQANLEWLEEAWGPAARNFTIRGTEYAQGTLLKELLAAGMERVAEADQCHAIALDARAPKFDAGIVSRIDSVPFSIMVNRDAQRFYDEGEDFWPKRYAIWGRLIAQQPDQIAYSIIDAKSLELFMPSLYPPIQSDTVEGLAAALGLDVAALAKTVRDYNAACVPGAFDHTVHDGCRTEGLSQDKTNWARPLDQPPFYAYPMRPGITFTYMGVAVDEGAKVQMADGKPAANIWAAGEIMAGNVLGQGYLAGIGITIGSVFGRKAGQSAAGYVRN
ncbi:MAG: FAD-dependent tricarballylate dehydrogenase TcuA [Pseudomonadota bacterium]